MWNKREDEQVRPQAQPQPQPAAVQVTAAAPPSSVERRDTAGIGPSIRIVGDITGDEDLTILGKVEGKIVLPKHSVTVGQGGRVKADIQAKYVSVAGEVHGNLIAGEQIVIRKTATMLGNLTAPRVGLEDGCRFRGSVEMESPEKGRNAAATPQASPGGHAPAVPLPQPMKAEPTAHS